MEMDLNDRAECLNAGLEYLDDKANREALIRNALRQVGNDAADKIIREIEEAAIARDSEDLTRISRDMRARLDRATADD